jgi:hypothetical protein
VDQGDSRLLKDLLMGGRTKEMQVDGRNGKDLKLLMRTMLMNDEMPVLLLWIRTSGF